MPLRALSFARVQSARVLRHAYQRVRTKSRMAWYRNRETTLGNAMWRAAIIGRSPAEARRRRRMAAQYLQRIGAPAIDADRGYRLIAPGELPGMDRVVAIARELFAQKVGPDPALLAEAGPDSGARALAEKRKFLQNLLTNDDLRAHPELVDFSLGDPLLAAATSYLGVIPRLNRVDLLYSIPRPGDTRIASQLFHLDPEGVTQLKFFLHIFDVGDAEGPFTFIPAADSARIVRAVRELRRRQGQPHVGRYTDEEVAAAGGMDAIVTVKGPQGAGIAVDTTRCLHLGSRVRPGAFRLCLYVQYCSSFERGNVFDVERYRNDPVRYLAVAHSLASAGAEISAPDKAAG